MQVIPNVHQVPGVMCNVYLVVEPERLTLIDTGLPGSHRKILKYMAGLGSSARDLRRIIITHSDGDHVGALADLRAATGARVFASPVEAKAIAAGHASRELKIKWWLRPLFAVAGIFFRAKPAQVDEPVADGFVFPVLGELRVIETPGHTPGHISLFAPSVGVLFVGDSIVVNAGRMRGSTGLNNWDQAKSDASVRLQAGLGARIVCSGHGAVVLDAQGKFPQV